LLETGCCSGEECGEGENETILWWGKQRTAHNQLGGDGEDEEELLVGEADKDSLLSVRQIRRQGCEQLEKNCQSCIKLSTMRFKCLLLIWM